jgi:hypothetical protein
LTHDALRGGAAPEEDTISVLIHTVNQYVLNPFAPVEPEEPCE